MRTSVIAKILNRLGAEINPATEETLAAILDGEFGVQGVWGYKAGVSGSITLAANQKVVSIYAVALESAGSVVINGGDTIPVPYGATDKVSSAFGDLIRGDLIAPTIVFTGTDAYFVQYVDIT